MDSYDENIFVWDIRNMRYLLCLFNFGGGVWRIKWYLLYGKIMLIVCMYKGFYIFKFNNSNGMFCDVSLRLRISLRLKYLEICFDIRSVFYGLL